MYYNIIVKRKREIKMLRSVRGIAGYVYVFTERECEIIEKYFDSIRQFMDDFIVDIICVGMQCDNVELMARYDSYLCLNDYEEEQDFSQIMFNEFGIDI